MIMTRQIMTLDRALKKTPTPRWGVSSQVHMFSERFERAGDDATRALRLSPFDPLNYHPYLALSWSCLFTGRLAEAATYAALAIEANPGFSVLHASVVACTGGARLRADMRRIADIGVPRSNPVAVAHTPVSQLWAEGVPLSC
jgi:adenylate cyclase